MTSVPDIAPNLPTWFDVTAVAIGAVTGSLDALATGFDLTGVLFLAAATGLGGGLIRDTLLQRGTPIALTSPWLLPTAIIAGLLTLALARVIRARPSRVILLGMDAVFLGVYTISGTAKGLNAGLPGVACVLLGVLTGLGGGLLRDILINQQPEILRPGALGAVLAVLGASLVVVGVRLLHLPHLVGIAGIVFIAVLRLVAIRRGWESPSAATLRMPARSPRMFAPRRARRRSK